MQKIRENAYNQLQKLALMYRTERRREHHPAFKEAWHDLEKRTRKRRLKVVQQMNRKDV